MTTTTSPDLLRASFLRQIFPVSWSSRGALKAIRVAGDLVAIFTAFGVVSWFVGRATPVGIPGPDASAALAILFALVLLASYSYLGLYSGRASILDLWELQMAVKGMGLAAALFFSLLFLL